MPVFAFFLVFSTLASVGLPALNGFVGEFLILVGSYRALGWPAIVATFGVVLAAIYLLKMLQLTLWGPITQDENRHLKDLVGREVAALVPLCILMLWIGVAPDAFLKPSRAGARVGARRRTRRAASAAVQHARLRAGALDAPNGASRLRTGPPTRIDRRRGRPTDEPARSAALTVPGPLEPAPRAAAVRRRRRCCCCSTPSRRACAAPSPLARPGVRRAGRSGRPGTAVAGRRQLRRPARGQPAATQALLAGGAARDRALGLLASQGYLRRERILSGEYHALLLWCAAGLLLMLRATELLTIFLALELLSLCLYPLAAYHRRLALAGEAAIKYFLMGAFVSAFVLYGIALVYGATGSTRLDGIGASARQPGGVLGARQPRPPAAGRGLRLQDEPRAVPRLVAGHLPGRALAVRGLPLGGAQGGERAGALPRCSRR